MENQNQRGFFGIIITKEILDNRELSLTEKFIYGYIASFQRCCFESNEKIALKLGVSESAVAHAIPKLAELGYVFVEKVGNNSASRRIYSVLDNPKKLQFLAKKGAFDGKKEVVENPVENSANALQNLQTPMQNLHTLVQNLQTPETGVRSAKFADIEKNKIRIKSETEQEPNKTKPDLFKVKRSNYESDEDYEKAFYQSNTICLGG